MTTLYRIQALYPRGSRGWTRPADMDHTLADLLGGQVDRPAKVAAEGGLDVSSYFAARLAGLATPDEPLTRGVFEFVERQLGCEAAAEVPHR